MTSESRYVEVFVEIEQFSNEKYEINKNTGKLELDRVLPHPYFYPYSYGFIPNTLAVDGDELDALIITDLPLKKDNTYNSRIVGILIMEDEKGLDEKILCVLDEDQNQTILDISDFSKETLFEISTFFENYKRETPGKWSNVLGYENRENALKTYNSYKIKK